MLCLASLCVAAPGTTTSHLERSPAIVGGDINYPPYEFLNEQGKPSGYNVELTRAIAKVMGMDVEIRLAPWSEVRRELGAGTIDILQGMVYTQERLTEVDFATPHTMVYQAIWTRESDSTIENPEELIGKDVIVMRGSVMHDFMLGQSIAANLILAESLTDALVLLAAGQHDAALVAKLPGQYIVTNLGIRGIRPTATALFEQPYGYAVRKGNQALLGRFNEGLAILKKSGRYQEIRDRWLGMLEPTRLPWSRILRYALAVTLPLLLTLGATILWSRTLQKKVTERTLALQAEVSERQRAMEELEIRQKQLIQADKMTSLGILVSGVAHEINNPNGLILLNLPLLQKALDDALPILEQHYQKQGDFRLGWLQFSRMRQELPLLMDETLEGARKIRRIVDDLKGFSRQEDSELTRPADLGAIVNQALRLVEVSIKKATDHFSLELAQGLPPVSCIPQRIEQVVINLVLNACQALPDRSRSIRLRIYEESSSGMICLEICDQGIGIRQQDLPHLTAPFYTTRREAGGTGLGLSISASIVKKHQGDLSFVSPPGQGTRVTLSLPMHQEQS